MRMMRNVLLAGASASGKSTLARALGRTVIHTSTKLRELAEARPEGITGHGDFAESMYRFGRQMDIAVPHWMEGDALEAVGRGVVVDAIRSDEQLHTWEAYAPLREIPGSLRERTRCVRVNVMCGREELDRRHRARGTVPPRYPVYYLYEPEYIWYSDRVPLSAAVQAIRRLQGGGYADAVIGAQYGSEGKGKLCSLLAPGYDVLVRSGGPNAGHWVRDVLELDAEDSSGYNVQFLGNGARVNPGGLMYCFHSLPSGSLHNLNARLMIAAGASINPAEFLQEVRDVFRLRAEIRGDTRSWSTTDLQRDQLLLDYGVVPIVGTDAASEQSLVAGIGSTGQGVGAAQLRRIMRVKRPQQLRELSQVYGHVSGTLQDELTDGARVMLEGTQGSGLSLYHGPYPYVTSRDTNVAGLLSEVGIPPSWVRDVWLVVRSLPIRTGGNSGPFGSQELSWEEVEDRLGLDRGKLSGREITSTTKRLRRVAEFDTAQFKAACMTNTPTRLFLTFGDYIDRGAAGVRKWADLPSKVMEFISLLEAIAFCPVAGVSTGPYNHEVAWRPGFEPMLELPLR